MVRAENRMSFAYAGPTRSTSCATAHDGADRVVLDEPFGDPGNLAPHGEVDRVPRARPVEGHGRDRACVLDENVAHGAPRSTTMERRGSGARRLRECSTGSRRAS